MPHDDAGSARDLRIADPVASIPVRLRKLIDKLVDGDARVARMQRELHQLHCEKAVLATQLEEISHKYVETSEEAFHDELTGLPNRKRLRDRFNAATAECGQPHKRIALLFLDLDNFKQINDDFGHSVGDQILRVVAARLQAAIRATDTACRYGGDEFVILLADVDPAASIAEVARTMCDRLAAQYQICGADIDLKVSIGTAIYPDDCQTWEDLVHHADAAMYRSRAKRRQNQPAAIGRTHLK